MAESIQSSTTDRHGEVYLLVKKNPNWWMIRNAGQRQIKASGDERYVTNIWREFVTEEKRAISANYVGLVGYSLRQNVQRS